MLMSKNNKILIFNLSGTLIDLSDSKAINYLFAKPKKFVGMCFFKLVYTKCSLLILKSQNEFITYLTELQNIKGKTNEYFDKTIYVAYSGLQNMRFTMKVSVFVNCLCV